MVLKREVDSNCGIDIIKKMIRANKNNQRKVLILTDFPSDDVTIFKPIKKISLKKIKTEFSKVMKDKNNSRKIIILDDVSKFLNRKKK